MGGGASVPVTFDVRTAFDFAISLSPEVGGRDEVPEADRAWLEKAKGTLPKAMQAQLESEQCAFATGLLVDRPDVKDAASLVDLLRGLPGRAFAQLLLDELRQDPDHAALVDAALAGDQDALDALLSDGPDIKHGSLERLVREPDLVVAETVDLLAAWLPTYQEIEPRVRSIIERDAALRASDQATLPSAELVERTTNGIRWLPEPGVRRVILAPSYLARPYNFVFAGGDWRMFVYPIADAALEPEDPLAPPPGVLRLHRALGDETRLRVLRLLRDRDMYLTEIADRLALSKPTIKHHLAQLRSAGLVTVVESGTMTYYTLRRERVDDATAELRRYLS